MAEEIDELRAELARVRRERDQAVAELQRRTRQRDQAIESYHLAVDHEHALDCPICGVALTEFIHVRDGRFVCSEACRTAPQQDQDR